jgi:hypothetical protein
MTDRRFLDRLLRADPEALRDPGGGDFGVQGGGTRGVLWLHHDPHAGGGEGVQGASASR